MLLLATKGDGDYWSTRYSRSPRWTQNNEHRRMWCAEIVRGMLQEGLVATLGYGDSDERLRTTLRTDGVRTAMHTAGHTSSGVPSDDPHTLTAVVAQIRGLRLLQSMAPTQGWSSKLGGFWLPHDVPRLLTNCFAVVCNNYNRLPQPPWTDPPVPPWGPQPVAGHATDRNGEPVFVGEHSDLLWRALTEPDYHGATPLKHGIMEGWDRRLVSDLAAELFCVAALYDETAAKQLTHGLFAGVPTADQARMRKRALRVLDQALERAVVNYRWTVEQQQSLRGFRDTVYTLEP